MSNDEGDLTGTPPSLQDIAEAQGVVARALLLYLLKVPPELAVQLPNILRCLEELVVLRKKGE